jgi:hypothetical protein
MDSVLEREPQCCGLCRFSRETAGGLECRRRPPVIVPGLRVFGKDGETSEPMVVGFFPLIQTDEWCGEFERR